MLMVEIVQKKIHSPNGSYLLYCWHRLDIEEFLMFTVCILDKFQKSNSKDFSGIIKLVCNIKWEIRKK